MPTRTLSLVRFLTPTLWMARLTRRPCASRPRRRPAVWKREFNSKRLYCVRQARRKFYGEPPAGIELGGYPGELVNVTPQSLKAEYDRILSTASIDVMVQGVDEARVAEMLLKSWTASAATRIPSLRGGHAATPLRHFKEEIPGLTQAKLCMLFTTGEEHPNPPSVSILRVAMSVLGGSATSRLFRNVREKQSLCYYCGSAAQRPPA